MTKWALKIQLYHEQNFEILRLDCIKNSKLFEDPFFPASIESLSNNYEKLIPNWQDIIWKRPGEIIDNPQLIVNGIKRTDPCQGDLGNCWFIAAMSTLTQNTLVLKHVIPLDQSFNKDWYAGIFHFRFWHYQQWYDIVIDDRLPYLNSEKRLWSARNIYEINEFWVSLLEKAYAKLNGNYTNLNGGLPVNALTNFTGGIEQRFELKSIYLNPDDLFNFICSCIDYGSLLACSININKRQADTILSNGLVVGHTYSITNYHIISLTYENKTLKLSDRGIIRFRNPWGNNIEWNGKWSDNDPIWNLLDDKTRQRLSIRKENDGEFWMAFKDFYKEFDVLEVCHISPDTYDELGLTSQQIKHHWRMWYTFGSWRAGENSGGSCANSGCRHGCYYWRNPQFVIELTLNRSLNSNRLCMMIIALMQKPISNEKNFISNEQYIQIRLFRIKPNVKISEKKIYKSDEVERIASTGPYVNRREVSLLLKTTTGTYLIVPSMADVNKNCDFLLRIFSEDTTMGRTFVNIFSQDNYEDTYQQYTKLEQKSLSRSKQQEQQQRLDLILTNNEIECHPIDIQLYTWSGPGYKSGDCWHHGYRFSNGETWGKIDISGSPYCLCEQGKVRIFYNQQKSIHAESLTILRPTNGILPTSNDLAKWPILNYPSIRQRIVICSINRLGIRIKSKDGCIGCKCSQNGHWLCRRIPILNKNQTMNQQKILQNHSDSSIETYHVNLLVTTLRIKPECSNDSIPKFCILIERLALSNISRYIEIPRETSWIDRDICTRCSCTLDGQLKCEYIHQSCKRSCLLHKKRPISIMYYFPSNSKWLTLPNDKCRTCMCINGKRECLNCDGIIKININQQQTSSSIGEYYLLSKMNKITPCLLQTGLNTHRLIYPGQQTWLENRCYFCSKYNDQLIIC